VSSTSGLALPLALPLHQIDSETWDPAATIFPPVAPGISHAYLMHHGVCPVALIDAHTLAVALAPDAFRESLGELATAYDCRIVERNAARHVVEQLIERFMAAQSGGVTRVESIAADDDLQADARDLANQPPVVRYVNVLVRDAYDAGASDVHLEASRSGLIARFRIDGVLTPATDPPAALRQAVVSRIKLLAELDIAERRKPQDGRVRIRLESRELDLRVSTVPTMFGESVVLRLLERGGRPVRLDALGMPPDVLRGISTLASRAHGMLLVTGPTGSGKTTTLYAALQQRDTIAEKIVTVEDPVEYQLAGVTQVPVHRQAGVTFSSALRSILRQDPDVVMIGEMRDAETAEIAVQAAMTGHLVFSTLHTNDAVGAIPRLFDLGVQPYLVAGTLDGILAQRLVRTICAACAVSYAPDPAGIVALAGKGTGMTHEFVRGNGCRACRGTGYSGRIGLFELLTVDDSVREAISHYDSPRHLRETAYESGLLTMREDGWTKVLAGITTVEEVLRVVQS
jgi:general secretion pathway protein E